MEFRVLVLKNEPASSRQIGQDVQMTDVQNSAALTDLNYDGQISRVGSV